MTPPLELDTSPRDLAAIETRNQAAGRSDPHWARFFDLEAGIVRRNLPRTGYPEDKVQIVLGRKRAMPGMRGYISAEASPAPLSRIDYTGRIAIKH